MLWKLNVESWESSDLLHSQDKENDMGNILDTSLLVNPQHSMKDKFRPEDYDIEEE